MARVPINWPNGIKFMSFSKPHSSLSSLPFKLKEIQHNTSFLQSHSQITRIDKTNHPAVGQFGLFAIKPISKGSFLGNYTGFITTTPNHAANYTYYISTSPSPPFSTFYLDAHEGGNETRFINDFRGIKQEPNVNFQKEQVDTETWSVGMVVVKDIGEGEELLCDYGSGFWTN